MESSPKKRLAMPMPDYIEEWLKPHIEEREWNWSEFFEVAFKEWLEWYPERPSDWTPHSAPRTADKIHAAIDPNLLDDFDTQVASFGITSKPNAYWSAVMHYMRVHGFFSTTEGHTPSIIHTYLYPEDIAYLEWFIRHRFFTTQTEFVEAAVRNWLGERSKQLQKDAIFDYLVNPGKSKGQRFTISLQRSLHEEVRHYSELDEQTFPNIYFTALNGFLSKLQA